MGFKLLVPMLCCVSFATSAAKAQTLPSAPLFPLAPTEPRECQTFANDVQKYEAELTRQHEDCLKAGKEDRPNLPPNSPVCSRSACQILHDLLFSNISYTSVKVLHQRIDACYAQVKEYQDRQAAQKREAKERERADSERAARDQESANEARRKEEEQRQPQRTRISPTPAPQSSANNPAIVPPSQKTGQPYSVDSMKVPDTPQTEQARQAAKDREQEKISEDALNEMADPFGKSGKSASDGKSTAASDGIVDPFGNSSQAPKDSGDAESGLLDPFANGGSERAPSDKEIAKDKALEIGRDKASELIQEKADEALKALDKNLKEAQLKLDSADFKVYRAEVEEAEAYLKGLDRVLKYAPFIKDAWEASSDSKKAWNDFVGDCESKGFEYVLKRLSPQLSKVLEGPVVGAVAVFLDSSSTQTPKQDFDPMTAINNPSRYSFEERVAALQKMYVSEEKHAEVWNDSKRQWLRELTLQVYNSPDNPNIHLAPSDNSNIHLTPQ